MKAKIKYKALTFDGKIVQKVIEQDFPDFEEKKLSFTVNEVIPIKTTVSVTTQIMEHLDRMDKRDLMEENDWHTIIDYWVYVQKKKVSVKQQVAELAKQYLSGLEHSEKLLIDFIVVYSRLYDRIKTLKAEDQLSIVLETMGIGYDASSHAYKHMTELLMKDGEIYEEKLLNYKNQKHGNQIQGHQEQA